jgi:hypothetical protein
MAEETYRCVGCRAKGSPGEVITRAWVPGGGCAGCNREASAVPAESWESLDY